MNQTYQPTKRFPDELSFWFRPKFKKGYEDLFIEVTPLEFIIQIDGKQYFSIDDLYIDILGKNCYTTVSSEGIFEKVFLPLLSERQFLELTITRNTRYKDFLLYLRGDGDNISLRVRLGNKYGYIYNLSSLTKNFLDLKDLFYKLRKDLNDNSLSRVPISTATQLASDILLQYSNIRERLPSENDYEILRAFYQSYKGARFESIVYGTIETTDYDINSAFPSILRDTPSTDLLKWKKTTDKKEILTLSKESSFAVACLDLDIKGDEFDAISRGPFAYKLLKGRIFYPVGKIENIILNKPELDLLRDYPKLAKIISVHYSFFGIPSGRPIFPFRSLVDNLYKIRSESSHSKDFIKSVMNLLYGKIASSYTIIPSVEDEFNPDNLVKGSQTFNPIIGSHITAKIRSDLFRLSIREKMMFYGEFVDGLLTNSELNLSSKMGGFKKVGEGPITIFNSFRKSSEWKTPEYLDEARNQLDNDRLEINSKLVPSLHYCHTLLSNDFSRLGIQQDWVDTIPLGPEIRRIDDFKKLRVGDFLNETIPSFPLSYDTRFFIDYPKRPLIFLDNSEKRGLT